ncbi:MAG: hypothetical protein AB8B96_19410 [Lysobacterales bacterium]
MRATIRVGLSLCLMRSGAHWRRCPPINSKFWRRRRLGTPQCLLRFAGTLGCVALLLRKGWAVWLFVLSLIGVLAQQVQHFVLTAIGKNLDTANLVMTIMIPVVGVLLIWLCRHASVRGWVT